jgi:hypothetical protein
MGNMISQYYIGRAQIGMYNVNKSTERVEGKTVVNYMGDHTNVSKVNVTGDR